MAADDAQPPATGRALVPLISVTVLVFVAWAGNLAWSVGELREAVSRRVAWLDALQDAQMTASALDPDPTIAARAVAIHRDRLERFRDEAAATPEVEVTDLGFGFDAVLVALDGLATHPGPERQAAVLKETDRLINQVRRDNGLLSARLGERFSSLLLTVPASLVLAGATLAFAMRSNRQAVRLQALGDALGAELIRHQDTLARLEVASARHDLVVRAAADGIWEWEPTTGRVEMSPRFREMTGLPALEETLAAWLDRVHPDDRATLKDALEAHVAGRTPQVEAEYRLRDGGGRWRWMLARGLAERRAGRVRVAGSQTDITDRRSAAAMQERHQVLAQVTEAVGIGVATVDAEGGLHEASATLRSLTAGWPDVAAWWTAVRAATPAPALSACPECGVPAPRDRLHADLAAPDGRRRVFELTWSGHMLGVTRGDPRSVLMVRDITAPRIAEEAETLARRKLARSREELRLLVERVPDAVLIVRDEGVVFANAAVLAMLGADQPEQVLGQRLDQLLVDQADPARSDLRALRAELRALDGRVVPVELARPVPIEFEGADATLLVARDLSERTRLEGQLRLADRLASLGTLSAGLAHEINNPLAYVLGNLELLLMVWREREGVDPASVQRLERAYEGAERVKSIVSNLRRFARTGGEAVETIPLAPTLEATLPLVGPMVGERARLVVDAPADLAVSASAAWLGQILLNLLVNAAQAIPPGHPEDHRVTVRARAVGDTAVIEVSDTGGGIPAPARERIFDPFFTTKPPGEGTGLGLFMCHELATRMGGSLVVADTSAAGTTFRLTLALGTRDEAAPRAPAPGEVAGEPARVLVVDDEPAITELIGAFLKEHRVTTAATAGDGLRLALAQPWDVIICDLMLPDFSGMELFERLSAADPERARKVVFVTAGSFSTEVLEFLERVPNPRLFKPFDGAELVALVERRAGIAAK